MIGTEPTPSEQIAALAEEHLGALLPYVLLVAGAATVLAVVVWAARLLLDTIQHGSLADPGGRIAELFERGGGDGSGWAAEGFRQMPDEWSPPYDDDDGELRYAPNGSAWWSGR